MKGWAPFRFGSGRGGIWLGFASNMQHSVCGRMGGGGIISIWDICRGAYYQNERTRSEERKIYSTINRVGQYSIWSGHLSAYSPYPSAHVLSLCAIQQYHLWPSLPRNSIMPLDLPLNNEPPLYQIYCRMAHPLNPPTPQYKIVFICATKQTQSMICWPSPYPSISPYLPLIRHLSPYLLPT